MLEIYVETARNWFIQNNKDCPKLTKDWVGSGVNIPPKMGRDALKSKGIKPSDIINAIYGEKIAKSNNSAHIDYSVLGLRFEGKELKPNSRAHYNVVVTCLGCNKQQRIDYGTVVRWWKQKQKYCSLCRGASGNIKTVEYYSDKLRMPDGFTIVDVSGRYAVVQHTTCGNTFTRTISALTYRDTDSIKCAYCDSEALYGKKVTIGGVVYASQIEAELTILVKQLLQGTRVLTQVLYKNIVDTDRLFRADIYIPEHSAVIEITSRNNNLSKYTARLLEKEQLLYGTNIKFFVAKSTHDIYDIVQLLHRYS